VSVEMTLDHSMSAALAERDPDELRRVYEANGQLLVIDDFLPEDILDGALEDLRRLRPRVHRNHIPKQKKGGAVSRHSIDREGDMIADLYRSAPLREFLEKITGATLLDCPDSDPHTYALYLYSESGDHIGWHFDTSFYRGRRFTVIFGLVDNESCHFECELHRKNDAREVEARSYRVQPGSMILFDGDNLWHRVTKMAEGDNERVVISMEFVTDRSMNPVRKLISNVKDSFAYFGLREVFGSR